MIEVDVRKRLGAFELDVAFQAPAAGVTVLFGPSGAGKSSALAAVAGALKPDAGRIAVGGRVLFDSAAQVSVAPHERRIGWVHQDARLFPHLNVAANLRYGLNRARGRPVRASFDEVVDMLGVAPLLDRAPRRLSGGERQRVALGRALLGQPDLLLLDEPLAALDAARKAEILPFIERLIARYALPALYVTHDAAEARRLSTHVVRLSAGRLEAEGPPQALLGAATAEATVLAHDGPLTRLTGDLAVPLLDAPPGARVRVSVQRV